MSLFDLHKSSPDGTIQEKVRDSNGDEKEGITVRVSNFSLRGKILVGCARTDDDGAFELHYDDAACCQGGSFGPNLAFELRGRGRELTVRRLKVDDHDMAGRGVIFRAPCDVKVEVIAGNPVALAASEFERIAAAIQPLLAGVEVADMTAADQQFLTALPK
jgi:hypothetical protein